MYNISSVAVTGDVVWVGSHSEGGLARMSAHTSPAQTWSVGPGGHVAEPANPDHEHASASARARGDGALPLGAQRFASGAYMLQRSNIAHAAGGSHSASAGAGAAMGGPEAHSLPREPAGDPWTWLYYHGPRWLPSNTVLSLLSDNHDLSTDGGVWAVTPAGLGYLQLTEWTLEQKAAAWKKFQYPQHMRHGYMCSVGLTSFGDRESYVKMVSDNDGLWSSNSILAQGYRRKVALRDANADEAAEALATGWRGFEGLELASSLTPAYPRYVARSFCKMGEAESGCPASAETAPAGWYNATKAGWMYKGDTSSDTLAGHMVSYPVVYDWLADSPAHKDRVLALVNGITQGLLDSDYFLIDPETGKPTKWGYYNPRWLNDDPQYYSERAGNSLSILGMLASAFSLTGRQQYHTAFWHLVNEHRYDYNLMNVKIDSCGDENHSDTNLMMLAYHTMFYSLWRLDPTHERYAAVKEMTDLAIPGLHRVWLLIKDELNPTWLSIIAGTAGLIETGDITEEDLDAARWSLRHSAIDGINWQISGSQRTDLHVTTHPDLFYVRLSDPRIPYMRNIRPPSEQFSSERNLDPFTIDTGGSGGGMGEVEPGLWQMPYYMMKANGFV